MKIILCNPQNSQGKTHSRKGMYAPLGMLSLATVLRNEFSDQIKIKVIDEDIGDINWDTAFEANVVCFYSTSFNYANCVKYATSVKKKDATTIIGGPHASVLAKNIIRNQPCFDYAIKFEAEQPLTRLISLILGQEKNDVREIPNLVFRENGKVINSNKLYENNLLELPIPSREFVPLESYIKNFSKVYPDKSSIRPASIYSSKGCSWRDKTGGCIFCARLEEGIRFRDIDQIWEEIGELKDRYDINSIWDISDDNLNNREWFDNFVSRKPKECEDLSFLIYSRVGCIRPEVITGLQKMNVEEVFLGVESGDNRVLQKSFKGQTANTALRACQLLRDSGIKYFPSFILGLPGETVQSMENTYNLCKKMAEMGGLERLGCTVLIPIPGSAAYNMLLDEPDLGSELAHADDIDLSALEKAWIERFTDSRYEDVILYRDKINELMKDFMVFGGRSD